MVHDYDYTFGCLLILFSILLFFALGVNNENLRLLFIFVKKHWTQLVMLCEKISETGIELDCSDVCFFYCIPTSGSPISSLQTAPVTHQYKVNKCWYKILSYFRLYCLWLFVCVLPWKLFPDFLWVAALPTKSYPVSTEHNKRCKNHIWLFHMQKIKINALTIRHQINRVVGCQYADNLH